ncbi:hypothetical protein HWA86_gp33 [Pseudoalteromonas phage HP1]|jgi:hypothetical protein|uniref:hypothetical protein n=1 Tax=Pseudoalteromonas phage HP1 TaxID=1357706 RepID=UPI0018AF8C3A|nr:hypothetical protein HWA86_gp33 [Pseudoalteromonas phage HP1]|tara:strand:- start:292 stop:537 length:246 start_codon:yes stop_codon:yes gene_type:complete
MTARERFGIPDTYPKDTHLTNWLKKNLMPTLLGAFIDDKDSRGTITKTSVNVGDRDVLLCMEEGHVIRMRSSEWLDFEKIN